MLLLDKQSSLSFAPVTAFAVDLGALPEGFPITVMIDGIAIAHQRSAS